MGGREESDFINLLVLKTYELADSGEFLKETDIEMDLDSVSLVADHSRSCYILQFPDYEKIEIPMNWWIFSSLTIENCISIDTESDSEHFLKVLSALIGIEIKKMSFYREGQVLTVKYKTYTRPSEAA